MALHNFHSLLPKTFVLFVVLLPLASSRSFNITSFRPDMRTISFQGDAYVANGAIQLTKNQRDVDLRNSVGRAMYYAPVRVYDATSGNVTDFTTTFSFTIKQVQYYAPHGDGLSFFLAPITSLIPPESDGGSLGLISRRDNYTARSPNFIAVEFDSFSNQWDPKYEHVGININSIVSTEVMPWNDYIRIGWVATVQVSYSSASSELTVCLRPLYGKPESCMSHYVNLKEVLPEWVRIGFSASTGECTEIHNVLSWEFSSTL